MHRASAWPLLASGSILMALWWLGPSPAATGPATAAEVAVALPPAALRPTGTEPETGVHTPAELREVVGRLRSSQDAAALRRAALRAPDPLVAGNAVRALGRLRAEFDPELLALLDDPRPRMRQELVLALGECRREVAVASLERVLTGSDAQLRLLAIQALGRHGSPAARAALAAFAAHAETPVERAFLRVARSER